MSFMNESIFTGCPNEVGNDIEPFIKRALNSLNLNADVPTGPSGSKKATGYPDILFWFNKKPYYLECTTFLDVL